MSRKFSIFAICSILIIAGCDDEYPFEPMDYVPAESTGSLSALHFPTTEGCSWQYELVDEDYTFTREVTGTRYINSYSTSGMESDAEFPVSDLAWLDQLYQIYGAPVRTSYFTKDLESYTEYAVELWVESWDDTLYQKIIPKRVLWLFPLELDKEWTVMRSYTVPEVMYTRKVISTGEVVTVPAGTFRDVFYVEEYTSIAGFSDDEQMPAKYWLAPDVGVIKYEYFDFLIGITTTCELIEFSKGN